ncbi:S-crystallin 4-like [Argonauta hians]
MSRYTLYYFNGRGRAEVSRLMFALADVPFTDVRIEYSEWKQFMLKLSSPMLPVLETQPGIMLPQSMTIARFLAREFGFHGRNSEERTRVDYICQCFYDIQDSYMKMYHEKDRQLYNEINRKSNTKDEKLSQLRSNYEKTCERVLPFLEKCLQTYNNGNQYFLGDQLLLCDLMAFATLENFVEDSPSSLNAYPKLRSLMTRVSEHPKIYSYLKERPASEY